MDIIGVFQFNSIQFRFINVPSQQPDGQLQKRHNIQTQINSQMANYRNSTTYKHKSTARWPITETAQQTNTNNNGKGTGQNRQTQQNK
jgi:hypothetical protein